VNRNLQKLQFSDVTPAGAKTQGDLHVSNSKDIVGHLQWEHTIGAKITSVWVRPDYQHRGIATEMYKQASDSVGYPLAHDRTRTDAGEGWAQSVGGKIPKRVRAAE
jgi:GNAT superfamily N-acetyltransferase